MRASAQHFENGNVLYIAYTGRYDRNQSLPIYQKLIAEHWPLPPIIICDPSQLMFSEDYFQRNPLDLYTEELQVLREALSSQQIRLLICVSGDHEALRARLMARHEWMRLAHKLILVGTVEEAFQRIGVLAWHPAQIGFSQN